MDVTNDTFTTEGSQGITALSLSGYAGTGAVRFGTSMTSNASSGADRTSQNLSVDTGTGNTRGVYTEGETRDTTRYGRLDVKLACKTKLNQSTKDGLARICGYEGGTCPRHPSQTSSRRLEDLAPDHLRICAPTSNNKEAFLIRPTIDEMRLDTTGVEAMLAVRGDLQQLVSFSQLINAGDEILSGPMVIDRWTSFLSGAMDVELASMGLPSPSGVAAPPLAPTPKSQFEVRANDALSPLTDVFGVRSPAAERLRSFFSSVSTVDTGTREETFATARADDEHTAASEYDPAQTTYLIKRVADLSDYVEVLQQKDLLELIKRLQSSVLGFQRQLGTVPPSITNVGDWLKTFIEGLRLVGERANQIDGRVTTLAETALKEEKYRRDMGRMVGSHQATFTEPDKLPLVKENVVRLIKEVQDTVNGVPGAEILGRIRSEIAAAGTFATQQPPTAQGLGMPGFSMASVGQAFGSPTATTLPVTHLTGPTMQYVTSLETRLTQLEARLAAQPTAPTGHGAASVFPTVGTPLTPSVQFVDILQRLKDLERSGSGAPITMGHQVFSNESDVRAFVNAHVTTPYLGVLSDMVSLLQKLRINSPSKHEMNTEAGAAVKQKLDVVELSLLHSFAIMIPAPLDKSGESVGTSLHGLPACPTHKLFAAPVTGLEARISAQIVLEMTSTKGRFGVASSDPVARTVFDDMLTSSASQWQSFSASMNKFHHHNIAAYGMQAAESWSLVGQTGAQAFRSLRPIRAYAQDLTGDTFSPKERFVRVMWTMLCAHRLLDEFIAVDWVGHPHMTSITSEYVLRNRVVASELTAVSDKITTAQTQVNCQSKDLDGLEKDIDLCLTKSNLTSRRGKRQRKN